MLTEGNPTGAPVPPGETQLSNVPSPASGVQPSGGVKTAGASVSLSLAFSLFAAFSLFLVSASCGLLGLAQASENQNTSGLTEIFIFALGTAWCALLLLPGAWQAFRRLQKRKGAVQQVQITPLEQPPPARIWMDRLPIWLVLLVYPLVLALGFLVSREPSISWWALPPVQILAASLTVFLLASLALRQLQPGSPLRRWSVFGFGLVFAPSAIMVIELSAIFLAGVAWTLQLSSDPARLIELSLLAQRLQYSGSNPEAVIRLLRPFLLQPEVLFAAFAFMTAFVPLVEELIKPLGVWLLAGRSLNPVEGFAAGVLSGAGYALFENLFITTPGEAWALVSIGRVGTTTMHIFTAGITGYALASAWSQRRFLRLGLLFLASVAIHALWNSLTLMSLAGTLPAALGGSALGSWFGQVVMVALVALFLALLAGLVLANRRLRRYAIIPAPRPEMGAEPPVSPGEPTSSD